MPIKVHTNKRDPDAEGSQIEVVRKERDDKEENEMIENKERRS